MSIKSLLILLSVVLLFSATCKNASELNNEQEKRKALLLVRDPTATFIADSLRYLLPLLDSVLLRDQEYRIPMQGKSKKQQEQLQKEIRKNVGKISANDKKDLEIVQGIINKYGWLGYKEIGLKANTTMFMVIQHADLTTQENYLPMLRQALADKKLIGADYAMLIDRIEMRNKRPQIYGTQVITNKNASQFYPLLNPDSVEVWRKSIGIVTPLELYAKSFNVEWNLEKYKKILPELKIKFGVQDTSFSKPEKIL